MDLPLHQPAASGASPRVSSERMGPVAAPLKFSTLRIDRLPLSSIGAYDRNVRAHSRKQITQIAASIREFGFTNPVLVDRHNTVVAGHGRLEAAKLLGMSEVPAIRLEHLSDAQKRAYVLADNRLAEKAGWDEKLLALELQELSTLAVDFDVEITGFDTVEIDLLVDRLRAPDDPAADQLADPAPGAPASRPGDLWLLGPHRLLCGDALDQKSFEVLLGGSKAQMVFTDPPYNVEIDGNVSGTGKHREFAMASGEMTRAEFTEFLRLALRRLAENSTDGAINFICMDWRHADQLLAAGADAYSELKNLCVWNKDNGGLGSFYRSKHELIFAYKVGAGPHINNFELGQKGRYRTNVWDYPGVNTMRAGRLAELAMHPTVKPVALVADAMRDCSRKNGLVLDSFAGSGTTIIAAARTGRVARAIELDPIYVDTAVRRWQRYTGEKARHATSGLSFDQMLTDRPGVSAGGTSPQQR